VRSPQSCLVMPGVCAINVFFSYTVGHDDVNSILDAPLNGIREEEVAYAGQLRMQPPKGKKPFQFSALFCGIGDARNLYGTLIDFGECAVGRKEMNVHLTIVRTRALICILSRFMTCV
jgi:hypothetical protein